MKIISDFRDYYDYAVGHDTEKKPVWNRIQDIKYIQTDYKASLTALERKLRKALLSRPNIFAINQWNRRHIVPIYVYVIRGEYWVTTKSKDPKYKYTEPNQEKEKQFYFNLSQINWNDVHQVYNSPLIQFVVYSSLDDIKVIINPKLTDPDIRSRYNPYQLYIDFEFYISNYLTERDNADIHRTDNLIIHQKGFDNKISFRHRK